LLLSHCSKQITRLTPKGEGKDIAIEIKLIIVINANKLRQVGVIIFIILQVRKSRLQEANFLQVNQPWEFARNSDLLTPNMFFPLNICGLFASLHRS
jgi:hypothetical protein